MIAIIADAGTWNSACSLIGRAPGLVLILSELAPAISGDTIRKVSPNLYITGVGPVSARPNAREYPIILLNFSISINIARFERWARLTPIKTTTPENTSKTGASSAEDSQNAYHNWVSETHENLQGRN